VAEFLNRSMSRREFNLVALAMVGSSGFLLAGCGGLFGGGGGGSKFSLTTVSGQLELPAGLDPAGLQTVGGGGFGVVGPTGFTVEVQSHIPSLALVWDANGRLVLMGMIDPTAGDHRIDAESTAAALMFLGLGGMALNAEDRRGLMGRIAASSELTTLTSVLTSALQSDPFAVTTAPQNLKDAIVAATNGFQTTSTIARVGENGTSPRAGLAPLLSLEPGNEVDGLTFVQSSNPLGYQVQNVRRRFGRVLTYVTSHVDQDNVETQETPPRLVGSPLDIPLTVGLLNSSGTGWSQVTSSPVPLKILAQDKKTKYEMIALTPVFGSYVPAVYSDSRFLGEVDKWKDECGNLRQSVLLAGFMELVLEILGLGGAAMSYSTVQGAIAGLLTTTQVIRNSMTAAYLGNVFYSQVISELASSMTFEEIFLAELPLLETLTVKIKADVAANTVRNAFLRPRLVAARAALVALVALGVIELVDIFAIAKDTTTGSEANLWTGLVFQPVIGLTATKETYSPGGQVVFTAQAPPTTAPLIYHWKASGSNLMVLDDGVTFDKLEFDSSNKVVTLSTTPSTVGDLSVRCEVFDVSNGGRVSLGSASKTLKLDIGDQAFSLSVARATRTFASGFTVVLQYIVVEIAVDEAGSKGVKITRPDGSVWTWKGSAFSGVTGAVDIYHPAVDINGDLVINGNFSYFHGDQQTALLARIESGRAYLPGFWSPPHWRAEGLTQEALDAQLEQVQQEIDQISDDLRANLKVQYLPGY